MFPFRHKQVEDLEEQSETKRRKVGGQSPRHPSSLPPSALTKDTFLLKYPFIKLSRPNNVGKFSTLEFIDSEALVIFIDYIYLTIESHKGYWYSVDGLAFSKEMSSRPLELSFFECFAKLSKSFFLYKESKRKSLGLETGQPQIDEEEITPTYLEVREKRELDEGSSSGSSSQSSYRSSFEAVEGLILNYEGHIAKGVHGVPDMTIRTFAKGFLRGRDNKFEETTVQAALRMKKLKTTAIVEFKDDYLIRLSESAYFQASAYAIEQALENLDLHRGQEISLLLCGNEVWRCGTLIVNNVFTIASDGTVQVDEDENRGECEKVLQEKVEQLRKYMSDSEVTYHPGRHAIGELRIKEQVYKRAWSYTNILYENYLFIQSLLRITLGDSILKINADDARQIIQICKEEDSRILEEINKCGDIQLYNVNAWKRLTN